MTANGARGTVGIVRPTQRTAGFEPNGFIEIGDRLVEVTRAGP